MDRLMHDASLMPATRMSRFFRWAPLACGVAFLSVFSSCSTLYWSQRAKDGADIFTFELQTQSYGASVRTGPVKLGLNYKSQDGVGIGLRGGEVGRFIDSEFALFLLGSDRLNDLWSKDASTAKVPSPGGDIAPADREPAPESPLPSEPPEDSSSAAPSDASITKRKNAPAGKKEGAPPTLPSLIVLRRKNLNARSPFGTAIPFQKADPLFKKGRQDRYAPVHHFTAVEMTVGLYFGVKVGINFGELLDFLTGFFGADILSDDLPDMDAIRAKLQQEPRSE